MEKLTDLLTVTELGEDRFSAPNGRGGWVTLFGGQIVAQTLAAGTQTIAPDRKVNSLHAYFTRPGLFDDPFQFEVQRLRDGGRFSNRMVTARQGGKDIMTMIASWHIGEPGPCRGNVDLGDLPHPDSLDEVDHGPRRETGPHPLTYLDIRPIAGCQPFIEQAAAPPTGSMWLRFCKAGDATPAMLRNLVAYISDLFMVSTAMSPHRTQIDRKATIASIDHSVWFHADAPADDWMFFRQDSPWAADGRSLIRGEIIARDGTLIATIAQEALLRLE